jgi:hypothetical protein
MDPLTTAFVLAPTAIKLGTGIAQTIKGNKMGKDNPRPEFEIPTAAIEALNSARVGASTFGMAGQDLMESKLDQNLANTTSDILGSATSSTDALAALVKAGGNRMASQTDLDIAGAQDYEQRKRELRGELKGMAEWQNLEFQTNEMQPFLDKAAASSALKGAGMQNVVNSLSEAGGTLANNALYNDILGNKSTTTTAQPSGGQVGNLLNILGAVGTPNVEPKEFNVDQLSPETKAFLEGLNKRKNPFDFEFSNK